MNPFDRTVIADGAAFCDRQEQLDTLFKHAQSGANVVVFGPRRYGKTSLVRRAQQRFRDESGGITMYADFYRVTSVESIVDRIARGLYQDIAKHKSLIERSKDWLYSLRDYRPVMRPDPSASGGIAYSVEKIASRPPLELLRNVLEDVGRFAERHDKMIFVALDEFQDVTDLGDPEVEAVMREIIQFQKRVAYVFAGSRRRVLVQMFADRGRPFFHSAHMMEITTLPPEDLKFFIVERFRSQGRICEEDAAQAIIELSQCAPYYAQALGFEAYALEDGDCTPDIVRRAFERVLESEKNGYEAILRGLSNSQVDVLEALAKKPTESPSGKDFLTRTGLSANGALSALAKLQNLDLVEQGRKKRWRLVDPVLAAWLVKTRG